jgi:phage repressor protein C with HTH and peptisase S24 domain
MARRKHGSTPEWAKRIEALRRRMKISQGELARKMHCSAMTVSRWERGLLAPSADHYIGLGKLAGKAECWHFWELAGLMMADIYRALPEKTAEKLPAGSVEYAGAGIRKRETGEETITIPLRNAVAATHGSKGGDRRFALDRIPSVRMMAAPAAWCPNPKYTSMLRIRGNSMEPLLHDGDIVAVDSFQTDPDSLDGKVVVVGNEDTGLWVTRFRHYLGMEVLEPESRCYDPVEYGRDPAWRIVGRVLWWVHPAP